MAVFIKKEYDYAIRICAYLAGHDDRKPIPLSSIASKLFISRPFATKIVYQLKQFAIINTVQGKDGGIFLNHPADEISFYDVLHAMGFDSSLNECLVKPEQCPLVEACKIHDFFAWQQNELMEKLKATVISTYAFDDRDLKKN